jgi:hypothetical protein
MGSQAYTNTKPTLMVPPELPPQVLCQLEVPHQLGVLQVQGAVDQSSFAPRYSCSVDQGPATPSTHPHTAPGPSHPRCGPTYPLTHPVEPPRTIDAGPPSPLRPLPVAHVLVQHQHHLVSTSGLPSAHVLVQHQHHLTYASVLPVDGGMLVPGESGLPDHLCLMASGPHICKHNTKGRVNIHIYIYNHMLRYQNHKT